MCQPNEDFISRLSTMPELKMFYASCRKANQLIRKLFLWKRYVMPLMICSCTNGLLQDGRMDPSWMHAAFTMLAKERSRSNVPNLRLIALLIVT